MSLDTTNPNIGGYVALEGQVFSRYSTLEVVEIRWWLDVANIWRLLVGFSQKSINWLSCLFCTLLLNFCLDFLLLVDYIAMKYNENSNSNLGLQTELYSTKTDIKMALELRVLKLYCIHHVVSVFTTQILTHKTCIHVC